MAAKSEYAKLSIFLTKLAISLRLMTVEGKLQPSYMQILVTIPGAAEVPLEMVSESTFSIGGSQSQAVLQVDGLPPLCHIRVSADEGSLTVAAKDGNTELYTDEKNHRIEQLRAEHSLAFKIGRAGHRIAIKRGLTATFGNYLLTGRIGGGGMADVYAARQLGIGGFNRKVAVKLIQPHMSSVKSAEKMFLDEARIAAEVNHHHAAKIIEIGEHSGILYMAMEYIDGISVSDLVGQFHARRQHLPADLVAVLIAQACSGLHALHELRDPAGRLRNVVHRDVSPSNMMLTNEGLLKVIDFGLARDNMQERTTGRVLKGKPSYMSPEQVESKPLDRRSDIFALGTIAFELLTGVSPFGRDEVVPTLYAVVHEQPPPLHAYRSDITERLQRAIYAALEKNRDKRTATAAVLGAEMQQVMIEYGGQSGQYLSPDIIAAFLLQQKFRLQSPLPALLTKLPESLTIRPPTPPAPPVKNSLISSPGRLVGSRLTGSPYVISRYLGGRPDEKLDVHKLIYLAQVSGDKANAPPADLTWPGGGTRVVLALCGRGPDLASLPDAQNARLAQLAARRHRSSCPPYLVPVFHTAVAWAGGPLYLVMPAVESRLLLDSGNLPTQAHERLPLVEALWGALSSAQHDQPQFVHGDIKPENLGIQTVKNLQVSFLDFSLEDALGLARRPPSHPSLYTAPECRTGQPPDAAADVFSAAAVSFALLGGDLAQLPADSAAARPLLPANSQIPAGVEQMLRQALHADPERRPAASEVLGRLRQRPSPRPPAPILPPLPAPPRTTMEMGRSGAEYQRIAPPPIGTEQRLPTSKGIDVVLYSLEIHPGRHHSPSLLPLSHVPGLLPVPLQVLGRTNGVVAELVEPSVPGKHRPSIYQNALEPSTRCDSFLIASAVENTHIDVGHRKLWVQRIFIKCQARAAPREPLLLALSELNLEIEAPLTTDRLIAFQTTCATSGIAYVALVMVRNSAV